jgi:hypothetical protein
MTLLRCQYDEDFKRKVTEGESGRQEYEIVWRASFSDDDTDLTGGEVLALVRAASGPNFDHVVVYNESYSLLGYTDDNSRAQNITCELEDPLCHTVWIIRAEFKPPGTGKLDFMGPSPPGHPLQWPVTAWLEIVDNESVVETAFCMNKLDSIKRGYHAAGSPEASSKKGPVINAGGQQTVDPLITEDHRTILNVLVYYPNALYAIALNNQFAKTIHCHANPLADPSTQSTSPTEPALLMGCPHFTWKYIGAYPEKPAWRKVTEEDQEAVPGDDIEEDQGSIKYCPTTVKLEFKLGELINAKDDLGITTQDYDFYSGWLKKQLNNGQTCFRKWYDEYLNLEQFILDPRFGDNRKMLLPTTALQLKESFDAGYEDTRSSPTGPRAQPTKNDFEEVETAEPINLNQDGTQITDPEAPANYIYFLDLEPADYYDITDYFGNPVFPEDVELPTFPLTPPGP